MKYFVIFFSYFDVYSHPPPTSLFYFKLLSHCIVLSSASFSSHKTLHKASKARPTASWWSDRPAHSHSSSTTITLSICVDVFIHLDVFHRLDHITKSLLVKGYLEKWWSNLSIHQIFWSLEIEGALRKFWGAFRQECKCFFSPKSLLEELLPSHDFPFPLLQGLAWPSAYNYDPFNFRWKIEYLWISSICTEVIGFFSRFL